MITETPAIRDGERIEELGGGIRILQRSDGFCFGTDAVLLSEFAKAKPGERLLDLCTGTGIVPLLLFKKTRCRDITALEIQPEVCDMAKRSVALSGAEGAVRVVLGDLKNHRQLFAAQSFDAVTCNPPYMPVNTGKMCESEKERLSRHELLCSLEDVIGAAAWLLKCGGRFYMIHRADRLTDIMSTMRGYRIEPKRVQLIHPTADREANLLLVEGKSGGKSGIKALPPRVMGTENA